MTTDTDGTNVTFLPSAAQDLPQCPMEVTPPPLNFCNHPAVQLDDHSRTMECAKCGAVLDPFDFLRSNAMTLQRAWRDHKYVKGQLEELNTRVDALKKEERRIKARIARLKTRDASVVLVRGEPQ